MLLWRWVFCFAPLMGLTKELRNRSLKFLDGVGEHPSGDWPGEASVLVLGMSLEAVKSLGQRYEQNAIVWLALMACHSLYCLGRQLSVVHSA